MKILIRLLLVASVLYGTGAHWAALQGAAWAGMLAARVSETSWAEAVASTFSGAKPCDMCRVVEKGSKATQAPTLLRSGPALDLAMTAAPRARVPLLASPFVVLPPAAVIVRSARPFVPPPKTALPV